LCVEPGKFPGPGFFPVVHCLYASQDHEAFSAFNNTVREFGSERIRAPVMGCVFARSSFCLMLAFFLQGTTLVFRLVPHKHWTIYHILSAVERVLCRSALVSEPRGPGFFELFLLVDLFEVLRERKQSQPIPVALGEDLLISHRSAVPSFLGREPDATIPFLRI
jgi:hypothetical protein